jgi:hypothetical protein
VRAFMTLFVFHGVLSEFVHILVAFPCAASVAPKIYGLFDYVVVIANQIEVWARSHWL